MKRTELADKKNLISYAAPCAVYVFFYENLTYFIYKEYFDKNTQEDELEKALVSSISAFFPKDIQNENYFVLPMNPFLERFGKDSAVISGMVKLDSLQKYERKNASSLRSNKVNIYRELNVFQSSEVSEYIIQGPADAILEMEENAHVKLNDNTIQIKDGKDLKLFWYALGNANTIKLSSREGFHFPQLSKELEHKLKSEKTSPTNKRSRSESSPVAESDFEKTFSNVLPLPEVMLDMYSDINVQEKQTSKKIRYELKPSDSFLQILSELNNNVIPKTVGPKTPEPIVEVNLQTPNIPTPLVDFLNDLTDLNDLTVFTEKDGEEFSQTPNTP